jgi:hypothetical protein
LYEAVLIAVNASIGVRKGLVGPSYPENSRHVYLHIKPVRAPVFCEIGLATGRDLNSRDPFLRVLSTSVEGAACIVSLVKLTIAELDDVRHDDQLEESGKNISAEVASESLHDLEKLGDFHE